MKKLLAVTLLGISTLSYSEIHRTTPIGIGSTESDIDGRPTLTKVCVDGYGYLILNVSEHSRASDAIIQMRKEVTRTGVSEGLVRCYLNSKGELVFE